MKIVKTFCNAIDAVNRRLGVLFSFLSLAIMAVIVCEVFLRRIFNMPQIWTQDMTIIFFACYTILICAYGFLEKSFVCVDVIFARFPLVVQYILHIITYFIYLIPFLVLMLPRSWSFFLKAFTSGEKLYSTWQPPVWPMKFCLFAGLLLLFIQSISEILKQLIGLVDTLQDRKHLKGSQEVAK